MLFIETDQRKGNTWEWEAWGEVLEQITWNQPVREQVQCRALATQKCIPARLQASPLLVHITPPIAAHRLLPRAEGSRNPLRVWLQRVYLQKIYHSYFQTRETSIYTMHRRYTAALVFETSCRVYYYFCLTLPCYKTLHNVSSWFGLGKSAFFLF